MRIRFWGTRGSLPVALTSAAIKQKLVSVLLKAMGKPLDTAARIEAYVEQECPTPYTFGGSSSQYWIFCANDNRPGAAGTGAAVAQTRSMTERTSALVVG